MTKLSKILSIILHPVFMPIVGIFFILTISHLAILPFESKKAILWLMVVITVFFPLAMLPFLYYLRIVKTITISEKHERLLPLVLTTIFYYFGYHILHKYSVPLFLQHYMLAVFVSVLMATAIHLKWKVSLHMIGIGGLIGLFAALSFLFQVEISVLLTIAILIAGIIGSIRLYLNEHTPSQIYSGFMLGFIVNFGIIVVFNT